MPPPSGFLPRVDTDWRERLKNPQRGDIISVRDVKEAEPKLVSVQYAEATNSYHMITAINPTTLW